MAVPATRSKARLLPTAQIFCQPSPQESELFIAQKAASSRASQRERVGSNSQLQKSSRAKRLLAARIPGCQWPCSILDTLMFTP